MASLALCAPRTVCVAVDPKQQANLHLRDTALADGRERLNDARPLSEIADGEKRAWERMTQLARRAEGRGEIAPMPQRQRRVIIERNAMPTVSGMLGDAYYALSKQLHQFRESAHLTEWDAPKVNAFGRLVSSLVSLQETERRAAQSFSLGEMSDSELAQLGAQAKEFLARREEKDNK